VARYLLDKLLTDDGRKRATFRCIAKGPAVRGVESPSTSDRSHRMKLIQLLKSLAFLPRVCDKRGPHQGGAFERSIMSISPDAVQSPQGPDLRHDLRVPLT
jgi:hypothetical protein